MDEIIHALFISQDHNEIRIDKAVYKRKHCRHMICYHHDVLDKADVSVRQAGWKHPKELPEIISLRCVVSHP